ncbi:hypothetical protein BJ322DRAFT_1044150 [Thelephora terrestris]|uniref:Yeast cell wall synthesis Kre9/Knh1-like N-terminal domain-containing protein n=1 Tax=Thelephora terrestris TaxID=56493 RepID=A0A9P6LAH3_9AGAM|nr:hypothetical protein BJ322DRAFT_1044150 [Thelephora terrestris]
MRAFSVLSAALLFFATALGISVTSPVEGAFWDASKSTQSVAWNSVSSDPNNFTISLVNMVVYPNTNVVLQQNVLTSSGSATVNAPSSGWPTGQGFQINFIQQNPTGTAILAQSQQFNITGTSTSFSSSVSPSRSSTSPSVNNQNTANGGLPSSSTDSSLPSQTDTTQGNTGGAMGLTVQMGYIAGFALVGALLA